MCGCEPLRGGIIAALAGAEAVANTADTDPLLRGILSVGKCIAHNRMTTFGAAVEWAGRARVRSDAPRPILAHVDFQADRIAMARERTQEARSRYDRALTVPRRATCATRAR